MQAQEILSHESGAHCSFSLPYIAQAGLRLVYTGVQWGTRKYTQKLLTLAHTSRDCVSAKYGRSLVANQFSKCVKVASLIIVWTVYTPVIFWWLCLWSCPSVARCFWRKYAKPAV